MKKALAICSVISALLLTSCTQGWTQAESELITAAAYSRMRVVTTANPSDSLFLREKCAPLTKKEIMSPEFGMLAASMIETVNDEYHAGVGIAAPQVGIGRRMVVVQRFDKAGRPFEVYVNPEITAYGEERALGGEGCLSVPDMRGKVERATSIELSWRDAVTFEPRHERIEGFTAVIFQHEIDHLDGTLYIDRASELFAR